MLEVAAAASIAIALIAAAIYSWRLDSEGLLFMALSTGAAAALTSALHLAGL